MSNKSIRNANACPPVNRRKASVEDLNELYKTIR